MAALANWLEIRQWPICKEFALLSIKNEQFVALEVAPLKTTEFRPLQGTLEALRGAVRYFLMILNYDRSSKVPHGKIAPKLHSVN